MNIKLGDIVKSVSGGYGPVEEIRVIDGKTYYWIDFKYGYFRTHEGPDHRNWATDVTPYQPGQEGVTRPCPNCGKSMSHLSIQAKTCSQRCRKALSRKAIAPSQDAITAVSETPHDVTTLTTKFTMPLMGELTISEVVESVQKNTRAIVTSAELTDGIVTLTIEEPVPDHPECSQCGQSLDGEMELKNGVCHECMWWL